MENYYALLVWGTKINKDKLHPTKQIRIEHKEHLVTITDNFCPQCGVPLWETITDYSISEQSTLNWYKVDKTTYIIGGIVTIASEENNTNQVLKNWTFKNKITHQIKEIFGPQPMDYYLILDYN